MKGHYRFAALTAMLAFMFLLVSGSTAVAADKAAAMSARGTIASMWIIWPKPGHAREFEAGVKAHAAWRKTAGEGFNWSIYQPVVGSNLDFYVIRSEGHTWKDMDAEEAWSEKANADEQYEKQAGQYAMRTEHYFSEDDNEHSHWIESKDYKYFAVNTYFPKPGMRGERMDALNKIQKAITDQKWPYPYAISNDIGGKEPMTIVIPLKGYADMADPDPSLMKVLAKSLGSDASAAATMKEFGSTIDHSDYTIYAYRPDLSTPK